MAKPRILLVDDDRDFLLALRVRLEASGYAVIGVSDVSSALAAVAQPPFPDLIILDIGLGIGNGILLLDRFRTVEALPQIPVIILTAQPAPFLRDEAHKRGVTAFFQKPADNAKLLAAIQQAIADKQS